MFLWKLETMADYPRVLSSETPERIIKEGVIFLCHEDIGSILLELYEEYIRNLFINTISDIIRRTVDWFISLKTNLIRESILTSSSKFKPIFFIGVFHSIPFTAIAFISKFSTTLLVKYLLDYDIHDVRKHSLILTLSDM